jgi:hypothetical protein
MSRNVLKSLLSLFSVTTDHGASCKSAFHALLAVIFNTFNPDPIDLSEPEVYFQAYERTKND